MSFSADYEDNQNILIVRLNGTLSGADLIEWKKEMCSRMTEGATRILLDLKSLETFSSDALGVFLSLYKRAREEDGMLKMMNLSPFVSEVFSVTRLINVFEIFNDEEVALRSFPPA